MKMRFLILFWVHLLDTMYTNMITARPTSEDCIFEDPKLKCEFRLTDHLRPDKVQVLEFSKVEWETLDFEPLLESFPKLQNISVSEGKVASIVPPRRENSIKVLELRRLLITNFSSDFLQNFPNIEIFNVRDNQLIRLSNDFYLGTLKELYLINNTWKCSEDLDWALRLDRGIAKDLDKLTCYEMPYPGKPLLPIAHYLKDLKATCTAGCQCVLEKVAQNITSDDLQPIISVNCSEQGLSELPETLPKNTRILHLEGNSIENLDPLTSNPIYRGLWDLFLDNNEITSIGELEGSYWLTHFRAFSLRGNKLTKLPAYALDNALLKNPNMPIAVRLYLGGNPWRCDCLFIPVFQELVLQKYAAQVKDIRDVKCSYVEGDENSLLPIIELTRSSVCRLPSEYSLQEGLDLLNAVLASLIIFIFGKLVYDYYYFKKTGKLPWIATKMP